MLTGELPFQAADTMELVHCHIAREPVPPHRRNPDVPLPLSKIVGKLLAKKAEDRYQSAAGLLADLETIRAGVAPYRFEPGRNDPSDRLNIPERLYGREGDVEALLKALERVRRGRAEMMLVAGHSGVGKSALVNEVHKPITRARGYFVAGKFDQFNRNSPYSALLKAMRELVRQILTESDAQLAAWRADLHEALAPNLRVALDVLPELELVTGPQPPVPELDAAEAANRFRRVVIQLVRALCARVRVIVLFLDDLQWADVATLDLLRMVLTDEGIERLLVIGAYRDNEIDAIHGLTAALREIRDGGGQLVNITLAPLGLTDVTRMLADTLQVDAAQLVGLARLILQKTQGNPLFIRQFLSDLHAQGLIRLERAAETERFRWTWNLEGIRSVGSTDNVVDLLIKKLRLLPPQTQEALWLGACIGSRFDVETLATVKKADVSEVFDCLQQAIGEDLVRPLSDPTITDEDDVLSSLIVRDFAFQHDRIQQAAYSLIDENERQAIHLTVGRRLRSTLSPEALADRIFEVVGHLNFARAMITDPAERRDLAALDLAASRRASDASAYSTALSLVRIAQDLIGEEAWNNDYQLTLKVFRQRASLEYLNGNFETCSRIVAETLEHARDALDRAEVYFTRIAQHTQLAEFAEAVETGYRALELVGVPLPRQDVGAAGERAVGDLVQRLEGRDIASLYHEPAATSPEIVLAQRSLRHLTIAAFLGNQELWPLVTATSVRLSLEHGHTPESALSYANYGLILGAAMGRYRDGAEFGRLALRLCEKFGGRSPTATVCLVHGAELMPWVQPIREALPVLDRGYQGGLNSGDILWAGYLAMYRVLGEAFAGTRIEDVLAGIPERLEFAERTRNRGAAAGLVAHQIVLSALAGKTRSSTDFSVPGTDEITFILSCEEQQLSMALCLYRILKAQALFLFRRPSEALEALEGTEELLKYIVNHVNLADRLLYQSLALAALHTGGGTDRDRTIVETLKGNHTQLRTFAQGCPENFLAKQLMVEAEIARIAGDEAAALDLYDGAIDAAHAGQLLQDEALANELAGRLVVERRPGSRVGAMYLRDARYTFGLWGAERKVEELELEFPTLLTEDRHRGGAAARTLEATVSREGSRTAHSPVDSLDINTLIKAGQTISGEVVLSRLLDQLLGTLLENAGGQRCVLILSHEGGLFVEAEASVQSTEPSVLMSIPIDTEQAAGIVPLGVVNFAARTGEMVVVDDAEADERFLSDPLIQQRETRSILCQPIMSQGELIGLVYLENSLVSAAFTPERAHLVSLLSGQIAVSLRNAQLVENLEEKVRERTRQLEIHSKFIEQTFGRYLSSEIAERILKSEDGLDFRGRKRVVTVMMSDIRGFTSFADRLAPEKIVELLNNYLSEMTTVIQTYNGTIDNFIGDAILTVFGVPFQRPDDAERAVACALQMQLAMERVNEWNAARDLPALEMGIGINTGEVVVGNIGSHRRAKYGVIGSNVNLAARIESFTVGGQVLISGPTRKAVRVPLTVSEALTVEPKGLAEPLPIYEVRAIGGSYGLETRGEPARHTTIDPPVRISYRLVEGKVVVGETWPGELIGLAVNEAVLRGGNTLPPYTDLQLTVEPSDDNAAIVGLYAKVLDRRAEDGAFAIRFTALPPQARLFLSRFGEVANDAAWR